MMAEFIAYRAAVDYLTVTFWDSQVWSSCVTLLGGVADEDKCVPARMMMYTGHRCTWNDGSIFWGEGVHSDRKHFIIQVSGAASDRAALALKSVKGSYWNITRIDLQITLDLPEWYKSRSLVDTLRKAEWKSKPRKVTLIDGNGDDTVYIGSRTSDRYIRIYVKEKDFLRFEVELKGDYAKAAWERYKAGGYLTVAGMLVTEMVKLPKHPIVDVFAAQLKQANAVEIMGAKPVKTPSKTFRWFVTQVAPAIERLLNDHDTGAITRDVLLSLLESGSCDE